MRATPTTTYRVQLRADFGFDDAAAIAPYLQQLGVSHLYCSPYLQAAAGSTHGYDVADPQSLNDELGGTPGHARLVTALRDAGLGQVLDIVPNHMAVDPANRWWWDVLEHGPASRYASFFDIDWEGGASQAAFTVLVPVLGDHYGRVIEAGELALERRAGAFVVRYHEHELPVSPRTLDDLLAAAARRAGSGPLAELADGYRALPDARLTDATAVRERHSHAVALASQLTELCADEPAVAAAIDEELAALAADPDRLDALLRRQNYRLAHWRTASEELDYRRFFNIETLVGVRVEDPEVFAATHALVLELVRDGTLDGLRIDHVDGLRDPERYLVDLAEATGGVYTVVEKILEPGERLPASWPVTGTSGYDFLIRVNNLFVDPANEAAMTAAYVDFTGDAATYDEVVHASKHQIMGHELAAEVERLTATLASLCEGHRRHRDHTSRELRTALQELVAHFGVYRTYVTPGRPATSDERAQIAAAVEGVQACHVDVDRELLEFLAALLAGDVPGAAETDFASRFQQLSAPVMAKGVEDTTFYRYQRLISLNEVGGDPGVFGAPVSTFHEETRYAARCWPQAMLTLSTHDTKRSADVRARLNVLSELPDAWRAASQRWSTRNEVHRKGGWPDRNVEYLLYQTLVGAWPLEPERATAFMAKATKEAKVHTSWADPVDDYDDAIEAFTTAVLADRAFCADVEHFLADHRIVERGRRNSLAQTALLLTCPGVPDIYQGSELWDLSLVDPDNRRPVDYELRRDLLGVEAPTKLADDATGASKLWLVHRLLGHRRAHPELHASTDYEALDAPAGVVAFARGPLCVVARCRTDGDGAIARAPVALPAGRWSDISGPGRTVDGGSQPLDDVLAGAPVAVLVRDDA